MTESGTMARASKDRNMGQAFRSFAYEMARAESDRIPPWAYQHCIRMIKRDEVKIARRHGYKRGTISPW